MEAKERIKYKKMLKTPIVNKIRLLYFVIRKEKERVSQGIRHDTKIGTCLMNLCPCATEAAR